MFTLPFTSTSLQFALPFGFLPTFLQVLALLVLLAGTIALFVSLYRVEMRRVSRHIAGLLLALRIVTVSCVFLVWTTSPVAIRTVSEPQPGHVVVAVDLSDSMGITDPERPLAEKLRLARTLGLHVGVAPAGRLEEWIAELERGNEPSHDATLDEVIRRCDLVTRLQAVELALASDGAGMLDKLKSAHAIELIGFAQSASELPIEPQALRAAIGAKSPNTVFTDLKLPLNRPGVPLAVVVFTDGRHNWGEPPTARKDIPIYSVNVAPREPASDVAIVSVKPAVTTVCRGSSTPVSVQVRATHWPAGRIAVELKLPGFPPLQETIRHDGADRIHEVVFHPRFDKVGMQSLIVEAKAQHDERPENNVRSGRVNVIEYKPRVLLIDGEARWEFRYLRNALTRSKDPELDVKPVVFRQPRIGVTTDTDAEKAGLPALKLPEGEDAFADFDCIILGDVSPEQFTMKDRERLEKYVADSGGSLIMVAGKRHLPLGFAESDPLRKLLPIRNAREFAPTEGFFPELTVDGNRTWFLRLGDSDEQNRKVWEGFPPHEWAAIGEAKDGAEVLALAGRASDGVVPSLARPANQNDSKFALFARQQYGFGRVLYLGFDSTWRWRFKAGEEHHNRFWKQVVQWAVADRLLPMQNASGTIRFGAREPTYEVEKDVEVMLRATDAIPKLSANAVAAVRVLRIDAKEDVIGIVSMQVVEGRPRELQAKLRDLAPGRYAIEPEVPEWAAYLRTSDGGPRKLRATFEVIPPESNEMADLSGNVPLMEELARESGGRVFELSQVNELADLLASRAAVKEHESSTPLDRSSWTLALVALLLALEWVIRKSSGLA